VIRRKTSLRSTKKRPLDALAVVRGALRAYADRGVFRGFSELRSSSQAVTYKFLWLTPREMQLSVDLPRRRLRFDRLLPAMPTESPLYADLKQFLRERHSDELPEHRRIDPRRALVRAINRRGVVSLALDVQDGEFGYGVNRTVNLVHELFVHLRDAWPEYLMEHFDAPRE
jgi:hypothetical protein